MADDHRPDGLYERDFYLWTQAQAEALRAEGRRQGGSNAVDWDIVAMEIADMGGRDVRECYSRIAAIIEHLLKLAWPQRDEPMAGWRATIRTQRRDLAYVMTATIRPKVEMELPKLHLHALEAASDAFDIDEPDTPRCAGRWRKSSAKRTIRSAEGCGA